MFLKRWRSSCYTDASCRQSTVKRSDEKIWAPVTSRGEFHSERCRGRERVTGGYFRGREQVLLGRVGGMGEDQTWERSSPLPYPKHPPGPNPFHGAAQISASSIADGDPSCPVGWGRALLRVRRKLSPYLEENTNCLLICTGYSTGHEAWLW